MAQLGSAVALGATGRRFESFHSDQSKNYLTMENKIQEEFAWTEYRRCSYCKEEKPIKMFNFKNKSKGTRDYRCKPCKSVENRKFYINNIESEKARSVRNRERNQQIVLDYIQKHPCIKCGEKDPLVLEFDHRDRATKSFNISDGCVQKVPVSRLQAEMAKCDVLCANCHNRKTAKESRYFNYRVLHEGYKYIPIPVKDPRAEMVE